MAKRIPSKDKWKSKVWYSILAPPMFGEKEVGETPASDPELVRGRKLEVTASELTGKSRQNHMKVLLEVADVSGTSAKTKVVGLEMFRSYLRSIVRRRRTKVELIQDFETKDGKKVRIKAVAMTVRKCHTAQAEGVRKAMKEILENTVKDMEFGELITNVLEYKLQSSMREAANKVYPVANMEIRKIELLS